jgi:hypothetical protein
MNTGGERLPLNRKWVKTLTWLFPTAANPQVVSQNASATIQMGFQKQAAVVNIPSDFSQSPSC